MSQYGKYKIEGKLADGTGYYWEYDPNGGDIEIWTDYPGRKGEIRKEAEELISKYEKTLLQHNKNIE